MPPGVFEIKDFLLCDEIELIRQRALWPFSARMQRANPGAAGSSRGRGVNYGLTFGFVRIPIPEVCIAPLRAGGRISTPLPGGGQAASTIRWYMGKLNIFLGYLQTQ